MPKLSIVAGSTSQTVNLFIQDSSSTTGAGLAGLAFNTASLTAYYALPKAASTAITLATLAAVTSAYSSGGFKEIDATNMPGWYRFDIPDAALASGRFVSMHLRGATNMAPLPLEIELTATNNQDGVRGGMTALPNAAAEAAGGLYTRGTGAGQINQDANGRIDANTKAWIGGAIPAVNVTGVPLVDLKYTLGTVSPATAGYMALDWGQITNKTTTNALTGTTIATTQKVDVDTIKTQAITAAAGITFPASLASPTNITAGTITNLTNAPTAGDFTATMKTSIGTAVAASAVASVAGNVGGNVTGSVGSVTGLTVANLDVAVSTRLASASYTSPDNATIAAIAGYVDTEVAAIKAKTDSLTFTVAGQVDVNVVDWKGTAAPAMTGDAFARLGAPAGSSVSADIATVAGYVDTEVAAIKAKTDNLPSDPADASDIAGAFSAVNSSLATIAGYIDTEVGAIKAKTDNLPASPASTGDCITAAGVRAAVGLASANLDTQLDALPTNAELATALGTADDAVLAQVALVKAKTDLIPAAPAAVGDIPTASAIADQVWDEAVAGHGTAGSTGAALSAANAPSAAAVADAVWDEVLSGHTGTGSAGAAMAAAGSAGDPWTTPLPGSYGAGTAGHIIGNLETAAGAGAITWTHTVTNSVNDLPIADTDVWFTSDSAGNDVLASGRTNQNGAVTVYLDAGTVYVWRQKSGFNFTNPVTETVVA